MCPEELLHVLCEPVSVEMNLYFFYLSLRKFYIILRLYVQLVRRYRKYKCFP